jgi:two-component system chemotaxis sensor kinase CheA
MQVDLSEFHAVFFDESAEHLAAIEEGLLSLESAPQDLDLINRIFRGAHSIKGNSGMFGFNDITSFTHVMENLLDRMREGTIEVRPEYVSLLLQATDVLRTLLAAAQGGTAPSDQTAVVLDQLNQVLSVHGTGDAHGEEGTAEELAAAQAVCDNLEATHPTETVPPEATVIAEAALPAPAPESAAKPKDVPAKAATTHNEASSIRVSVEKVDELINLVGELAIAQSMVNQAIRTMSNSITPEIQESIAAMERTTREVQERVMAVRMLPVSTIFRRFPRLVRDLAGNLGKQVALEIIGEETELDKQVIEQISDPLTHLVRNAIDHGIETPEDRRSHGKSEEGTLRLQAFHEGGNVIIDVAEDGRGLNVDKIRAKALSLGLISTNDHLTVEETQALIFRPGFSTADVVSDVSGRGVGMDVVKRNIEALNGSVGILSEVGRGTRFRIKLPLTMAILDGLSVSLNGEIYILPLLSVLESFRPQRGDLRSVLGVGEVVVVRGENVPLLRLHHLFGALAGVTDPTEGLIVIVENQGRKYGLLVDELVGQLQVVMKSVEENYHKIDGISGATILGDGRVALIVDVLGICQLARTSPPAPRGLLIETPSDDGLEPASEIEPELCEMSAG